MDDCLIIGAGVVGLSIAYEMAGRGAQVTVIDRQQPGQEASWAGGGILPAASLRPEDSAYHQLAGLSYQLHSQWAARLREETGIDNGFQICGELYIANDDATRAATQSEINCLSGRNIATAEVSKQLKDIEPEIHASAEFKPSAWIVPDSGQLRNPRHLKALVAGCCRRGCRIVADVGDVRFDVARDQITGVSTDTGKFHAANYCVCAGAWSGGLLQRLDCHLPIKPIRGQMLLFCAKRRLFQSVIHNGPHYLVPRDDGRVIAGSTLEDVGFNKQTTTSAIDQLRHFATSCIPALNDAEVERCWAGLRPGAREGEAFIGPVPGITNAFAATGHYRWGLYLSPGTATVMSELLLGESPRLDLDEFRLDRELQFADR